MNQFIQGQKYTREEIAEQIELPARLRKGGAWATGYMRWENEVFIFCNVGVAGRTGHDYPNRWKGEELIWTGKTNSTKEQPLISAMIKGDVTVHIFWRREDRAPWTYAGRATAVAVKDSVPVEVTWCFED